MLRKLGIATSYFVAIVYILSILLPALYCFQHRCTGPDLDGFMPAFFLTPAGGVAAAFSLRNSIQQIRRRHSWSWLFWPLALVFAIVLLGAILMIGMVIDKTVLRR